MPWTIDIQGPNGGVNLGTSVPFKSARLAWTGEGPGAMEVDILEAQMSDLWQPGTHRAIAKLDGVPKLACYLESLSRDSSPTEGLVYRAAGLGLASILDRRYIRRPQAFAAVDTPAGEIAWQLIDAVQDQVQGDMGFTLGTITGTTVNRTEGYCSGSNVGDEIRALANIRRGFDWEIDAGGAFNVWNSSRGTDLSGTYLVQPTVVNGWTVEADTSDLVTNVVGVGDEARPWGPVEVGVVAGIASIYGRRELHIDVDSSDEQELEDAAAAQVEVQAGARVRVGTTWIEGLGPWSFGDVWLQDAVSAALEPWFGGTQDVRCVDITVTIDPNPAEVWFVEHTFDALVADITLDGEG